MRSDNTTDRICFCRTSPMVFDFVFDLEDKKNMMKNYSFTVNGEDIDFRYDKKTKTVDSVSVFNPISEKLLLGLVCSIVDKSLVVRRKVISK